MSDSVEPQEDTQRGEVESPKPPSGAIIEGVAPVLGMFAVMVVGWQLMELAFTTPYSNGEAFWMLPIAYVAYKTGSYLGGGDVFP